MLLGVLISPRAKAKVLSGPVRTHTTWSSFTSFSTALSVAYSDPGTSASLSLLAQASHAPSRGPLHSLSLLPGTLFLWVPTTWLSLTSFKSAQTQHFHSETSGHPICDCNPLYPPSVLLFPTLFFSLAGIFISFMHWWIPNIFISVERKSVDINSSGVNYLYLLESWDLHTG